MSNATVHPRIHVENYFSNLGPGRARINNRGLSWNFDSQISIYTRKENTALTVGVSNGSVVNFRHTEPATISIEARYYFVKNIGQPYAQAFISGRSGNINDEKEISIALYMFRESNQYERYIDLLRNEEPVDIKFSCEIDQEQSHYKDPEQVLALLPLEQIQIRGLCDVYLRTVNEEVGEGE